MLFVCVRTVFKLSELGLLKCCILIRFTKVA